MHNPYVILHVACATSANDNLASYDLNGSLSVMLFLFEFNGNFEMSFDQKLSEILN